MARKQLKTLTFPGLENEYYIPSKTSDLTNDSNFLTQHQDISGKVDKVQGKGLSTEDYTTAEKAKLAGVEAGANNYVLPMASSSVLGGIKAEAKTANDTQKVRIGADGELYIKPGGCEAVVDEQGNIVLVSGGEGGGVELRWTHIKYRPFTNIGDGLEVVNDTLRVVAYNGSYTVSPNFTGTTLNTSGMVMNDDVEVEPIEVQRVSNPQGGRTIYIGGEING